MKKLSPMRLKILEFIKEFARERGYPPSVREIGEAVGLKSPSTVHSHLNILKEAGYLSKDDKKKRALSLAGESSGFAGVPLLGRVTAGMPILAVEEMEGFVPYDGANADNCFALRVRGDSMMNAGILDGDMIVVNRQPSAKNGEIVVALIEDEATVKRLALKNGEVWLMPENPAYQPIDGRGAAILGVVRAVYRNY